VRQVGSGTPIQAQLPACGGGSQPLVYGRGASQEYGAQQLEASPSTATGGDLGVYQLRIIMDPTQAATARAALGAAGRCPHGEITTLIGTATIESAGPTRAVAWSVGRDGDIRAAYAWILHGSRLVQLQATAGDLSGSGGLEPLPGGREWFRSVVEHAESRMDG